MRRGQGHLKIVFVLSAQQTVRITTGINELPRKGECLACQEVGVLAYRLGSLWRPRGSEDKGILIHSHLCPMNRYLIDQNGDYSKAMSRAAYSRKRSQGPRKPAKKRLYPRTQKQK